MENFDKLLLILDRVLELYDADYINARLTIDNDKYLKEFGFSYEKLSELIEKIKE